MSELVTLTIDGKQIKCEPNTLLVEAAAQAGILIPVYCYHPKLAPVGACRMCLVEVEGAPKLIASCTTPVRDGMVVYTNNRRVEKAREGVLEFLLIHHPLDCPVCDKGGECPLQDFTYQFGPSRSRFRYPKRHWDKPIKIGQNILLDRERCIMCFRCVRFCEEISHHNELGVFKRGNSQEIGTVPGHEFNSQFSGNTVELCPVGALTGAPNRFFGRTWEVGHAPSICTSCSTGCNIRVDTRHMQEVVRLWSRENPATDAGWLCDPGRFGFHFVNQDRLEDPKIRNGDQLIDAGWPQSITRAGAILHDHAKDGTLGILATPRLTNEELWTVSRFARSVLKTNNLDHTAKYVHPEAFDLAAVAEKAGFKRGVLRDIEDADQIITIGVDLSREQPVTELRVKRAVSSRKAGLVILDGEEMELSSYTPHTFLWDAGKEADTISALARAVASPSEANGMSEVGRMLAADAKKVVILGWRLSESPQADRIAESLSEFAKALGQDISCISILRHCNSRGALDLGVTPWTLPGGESVSEPDARARLAEIWGGDIPSGPGLSGEEMLKAAVEGKIKALWLIGDEPLLDAGPDLVQEAIAKLDALVYQGTSIPDFLGRLPDVVLAGVSFAEMEGSYTNTHGRVQRTFKAVRAYGRSRPVWQTVNDLAKAMGHPFSAGTIDQISNEIAGVVPAYADISWGRLGAVGVETLARDKAPVG